MRKKVVHIYTVIGAQVVYTCCGRFLPLHNFNAVSIAAFLAGEQASCKKCLAKINRRLK